MENKISARIIKVKANLKYEKTLCTTHICTDQTIAEVMENNLCEFNPRDPILIDAQTGSGKTTAIYNSIIPFALENREKQDDSGFVLLFQNSANQCLVGTASCRFLPVIYSKLHNNQIRLLTDGLQNISVIAHKA